MQYKSKHGKPKPHYPVLVFRVAALLMCLVLITAYLLSFLADGSGMFERCLLEYSSFIFSQFSQSSLVMSLPSTL